MHDQEQISRAAAAIAAAESLLITAGAGMGVDSGLPDFRGTEGFWNAYPAYRHLGLSFSQLANPQWFHRDPALAWGFYGHRLNLYRAAVPHAGFAILKRWAARMPAGAHVFTSNVDGHFQKAGFAAEAVAEVHGSIHHLQCAGRCTDIWPADAAQITVDPETFRAHGDLPKCPSCGQLARPNILMFGDDGWLAARSAAQENRLKAWLRATRTRRLAIIECGAGIAIPTVRHFSEDCASRQGSTLVRINMREPETEPQHIGIGGGALDVLRQIDDALSQK